MQKIQTLILFCFLICAFVLVGCGANVERSVNFYADERWNVDIELTFPIELLALYGSSEQLEEEITRTVTSWEGQGAEVSWKSFQEETVLIYTFHIEGTGWDLLNEIVFENRAAIDLYEGDNNQISFSYLTSSDLLGATQNVLTLNGDKIISSNGNQLKSGQVQWVNPAGRVEAVLTAKSSFSFVTILIIVLVLAVIGIGLGFYLRKNNQPQTSTQASTTAFCTSCGDQLPSHGKFCPTCGNKRL